MQCLSFGTLFFGPSSPYVFSVADPGGGSQFHVTFAPSGSFGWEQSSCGSGTYVVLNPTEYASLVSAVNSATTAVSSMSSSVSTLQFQMTTANGNIATLTTDLAAANTAIASISGSSGAGSGASFPDVFNIDAAGGASIGAAIAGVLAIGWAFRALIQMLRDTEEAPKED